MTESLKGFLRRSVRAAALLAMLAAPAVLAAQQPETVAPEAQAEQEHRPGGEANLVLPDLDQTDVGGYSGRSLLMIGLVVSLAGVFFGLGILKQIKELPVHRSMREISELIYETCKTYLVTQGKFI